MKFTYFVGIVALMLWSCGEIDTAKTENPPQTYVQAISNALTQDQIEKVEVLQIPGRILMRAQVNPEALEAQYHNKLIIRNIAATAYRSRLIESFKTILVRPRNETADLRWGVIFYSKEGRRIGALYLDTSGRYGEVNGIPVEVRGAFFKWLDGTFSSCMQ
jgi:hypothetical protein